MHIYTYIHKDIVSPIIRTPPNKNPPPLGGGNKCYYKFRRRHDYPLIRNDLWFDLPPS